MDGGDGWHRQRLHVVEDRLTKPDLLLGLRGILDGGDLIYVGPDDERTRLAPADHDHFYLALSTGRTGIVEHFCEAPHDGFGENVQAAFGIVERDPPNAVGVDLERW